VGLQFTWWAIQRTDYAHGGGETLSCDRSAISAKTPPVPTAAGSGLEVDAATNASTIATTAGGVKYVDGTPVGAGGAMAIRKMF